MAIRLEIKPYCEDCAEFEADVEKPTTYYADLERYAQFGDTVIRCEHRTLCARLKDYLEKQNSKD